MFYISRSQASRMPKDPGCGREGGRLHEPNALPGWAFSLMVLLLSVAPIRVVRTLQRRSICTLKRCLVCVELGEELHDAGRSCAGGSRLAVSRIGQVRL
jgi:hypothetical protein